MAQNVAVWPALPLSAWDDTRATLQLYIQIAGKLRLKLAPLEAEWQEVTLYLTSRGLTTSPMQYGTRTFQLDFDFVAHKLIVSVSDGQIKSLDLVPRTVAAFYELVMKTLHELGIDVRITTMPQEVPNPIRFPEDTTHASYDPEYAHRFWSILVQVDQAFKKFRAPFRGKHTAVQFFWGSFDLAYTRFSGKPAEPPANASILYRIGGDAHQICGGFWPGDQRFAEPAFYGYTYPKPDGLEKAAIRPSAAFWHGGIAEFLLRYEDVRTSASPADTIIEFLTSVYEAGTKFDEGWDPALTAPLPPISR